MGESPREVDKKPPDNNNQITQNIKDLLASREIENIFENSDFIYMLNQASGDRQILAKQLNISPTQLSYVTNSNEGEGLLFYGNVIIPFVDRFPKNSLYKILKQVKSKEKTMLRAISYVLTFSGGAVFGIAFLCLLQAGKGYPKKEE